MKLISDDEEERNHRISGCLFATWGGLKSLKDSAIAGDHKALADGLDELALELEVLISTFNREVGLEGEKSHA